MGNSRRGMGASIALGLSIGVAIGLIIEDLGDERAKVSRFRRRNATSEPKPLFVSPDHQP